MTLAIPILMLLLPNASGANVSPSNPFKAANGADNAPNGRLQARAAQAAQALDRLRCAAQIGSPRQGLSNVISRDLQNFVDSTFPSIFHYQPRRSHRRVKQVEMFEVPGWNLTARNLTQERPKNSNSRTGSDRKDDRTNLKKRKRPSQDGGLSRKIEAHELEKLWDERFGDHAAEKQGKRKSKEDRSRPDSHTREARENQVDAGIALKQSQENATKARKKNESTNNGKKIKSSSSIRSPPLEEAPMKPPQAQSPANLTPLQLKMRNKLTSARFRHLNQTLYTTPSSNALSLFTNSPDLFADYHAGFTQQVQSSWPTNPVDTFITSILTRGSQPANTESSLPRRKTNSCTIADLGCGDAPLARGLQPNNKRLQLKIHSYDLHSPNSFVTVADIASLPLRDGEADIAIFCLSLMGTNWIDFIEEAWRILRGDGKGELWIAEVKSRFGTGKGRPSDGVVEHSVGKQRKTPKSRPTNLREHDEDDHYGDDANLDSLLTTTTSTTANTNSEGDATSIKPFITILARRGFALIPNSVDATNKMFVSMRFTKSGIPLTGKYEGLKWNGKEYAVSTSNSKKDEAGKVKFVDRSKGKKGKQLDEQRELSREEEERVLKPCVYKSR
jgi:ribosomal RNA-processing protein 8